MYTPASVSPRNLPLSSNVGSLSCKFKPFYNPVKCHNPQILHGKPVLLLGYSAAALPSLSKVTHPRVINHFVTVSLAPGPGPHSPGLSDLFLFHASSPCGPNSGLLRQNSLRVPLRQASLPCCWDPCCSIGSLVLGSASPNQAGSCQSSQRPQTSPPLTHQSFPSSDQSSHQPLAFPSGSLDPLTAPTPWESPFLLGHLSPARLSLCRCFQAAPMHPVSLPW